MNDRRTLMESKWAGAFAVAALLSAGCTLTPNRAPIEERLRGANPPTASLPGAGLPPAPFDAPRLPPGAETSGRPGYSTVRPGDTLMRIGLENGQAWKDLIRWNGLDNPNVIEVGQVLRVVPPEVDPGAASTRPVTSARVDTRPLDTRPPVAPPVSATAPSAGNGGVPVAALPSAPTAPAAPVREGDDDVHWAWPAVGNVVARFDEGKVKGLVIGGKAGDPVLAAADGRVVYAGSGLRGYGNLVILKHNNTYLTAYAHNQSLTVKEDQAVRRGQKIAEMGSTDADGVKLHFEIRKQGKPVDPARLLPPR